MKQMKKIDELAERMGWLSHEKQQFIEEMLKEMLQNKTFMEHIAENLLNNEDFVNIIKYELQKRLSPIIEEEDLNVIIEDFMVKLGVPAHLEGYTTIREAIKYWINSENASTLEIYSAVASKLRITTNLVERRIRQTVVRVYERNSPFLIEVFGYTDPTKGKVVNSEFIAGSGRYIRNHIIKQTCDIDKILDDFMMKIGVPVHLKGYKYIKEAIKYGIKFPTTHPGRIYSVVEQELKVNPNTMKNDIDKALEQISCRNTDFVLEVFGYIPETQIKRNEFLLTSADYIKNNLL